MAVNDLNATVNYIGKHSLIQAKHFVNKLKDQIKPLAHYPDLGRQGRPKLPDFLRELIAHQNYIVFYRVLNNSRKRQVLHIKHSAQQLP